jgi:hypothetical protein
MRSICHSNHLLRTIKVHSVLCNLAPVGVLWISSSSKDRINSDACSRHASTSLSSIDILLCLPKTNNPLFQLAHTRFIMHHPVKTFCAIQQPDVTGIIIYHQHVVCLQHPWGHQIRWCWCRKEKWGQDAAHTPPSSTSYCTVPIQDDVLLFYVWICNTRKTQKDTYISSIQQERKRRKQDLNFDP